MRNYLAKALAKRLFSPRVWVFLGAYAVVLLLAYDLAFRLRFDFSVPESMRRLFWTTSGWVLALKLVIFHRLGVFHGWWRYVTFADLSTLLRASLLSTLAVSAVDYFLIGSYQIPRAVLLLDCGTTILFVGGMRSAWRFHREHVRPVLRPNKQEPTLMISNVLVGEALVRLIHGSPKLRLRIVGFLDENRSRQGSRLGGIPFLGHPEDGVRLAKEHKARNILVVANSISGKHLRHLVEDCRKAEIRLKVVPPIADLLHGSRRLRIRDVSINDLLRREPVCLDDPNLVQTLKGRRVMITGAGGSIGSEICRQVARHQAQSLILVERAENNLFFIDQELRRSGVRATVFPCIADICDRPRMHCLFERYHPQFVFHAAAHKHVPLMESNPGEAIKNNIFGTQGLVDMADEYRAERFVMTSTDKAINPASVMGLSKRIAERYVQAFAERSATKFVVVRFGNVLGSTGSVVPIFQEQIRRGGPVTITHPEMRRYFMSIPEATQLVLEASGMGQGGDVFVLNMGEPVMVMDLAREMIRLSGLSPEDIEIKITGARPGEKLAEEVYWPDENILPTSHPKLYVARNGSANLPELESLLGELAPLVDEPPEVVWEKLRNLASGFALRGTIEPVDSPVSSAKGSHENGKDPVRDGRATSPRLPR